MSHDVASQSFWDNFDAQTSQLHAEREAETMRERALTHGVPQHLVHGLVDYAVHHITPGGFLAAVFANDLSAAIARADDASLLGLPRLVYFIRSYVPSKCWGSQEAVREWLNPTTT